MNLALANLHHFFDFYSKGRNITTQLSDCAGWRASLIVHMAFESTYLILDIDWRLEHACQEICEVQLSFVFQHEVCKGVPDLVLVFDLRQEIAVRSHLYSHVITIHEVAVEGAWLHVIDVACEVWYAVDKAVALSHVVKSLQLYNRGRTYLSFLTYLSYGHKFAVFIDVLRLYHKLKI